MAEVNSIRLLNYLWRGHSQGGCLMDAEKKHVLRDIEIDFADEMAGLLQRKPKSANAFKGVKYPVNRPPRYSQSLGEEVSVHARGAWPGRVLTIFSINRYNAHGDTMAAIYIIRILPYYDNTNALKSQKTRFLQIFRSKTTSIQITLVFRSCRWGY